MLISHLHQKDLKIFCDILQVRAGVEMALIDAVANSVRVPLWRLFGGASNSLTTDITVSNVQERIINCYTC